MEAAAHIKELGVKTPIIALTANAMAHDKERYLRDGMDGYLPKPFVESELWQCLLKYLQPEEQTSHTTRPAHAAPFADEDGPVRENGRKVVDEALAVQRLAGNVALYEKVKNDFLETSHGMLAEFDEALSGSDGDTARRICHTMAGLAGTLGAAELQEAARNMECALLHGMSSQIPGMVGFFKK
ncbi:hypothetical protein KL86DPRO_60180 [uncultured delta proteobacterium]|uniref:Uncharacterized protein n=1 Tax=uncultured delta proteobacterium TaxID=34034 RepID=A0A212KFP8_9DELT|nr:hypothetical protein KL86DPRO_60180 [uncultured delta proteobacterium]